MRSFIIIIAFYLISCHSNSSNSTNSDDETVSSILNNSVAPSDIKQFLDAVKPSLITLNYHLADSIPEYNPFMFPLQSIAVESVFTKEDIDFMQKQLTQPQFFVWNSNLITNVETIRVPSTEYILRENPSKQEYSELYKTYMERRYIRMSIPCFSVDKKSCCIYLEHHNGIDSSNGSLFIFQKIGNKEWELHIKKKLWNM